MRLELRSRAESHPERRTASTAFKRGNKLTVKSVGRFSSRARCATASVPESAARRIFQIRHRVASHCFRRCDSCSKPYSRITNRSHCTALHPSPDFNVSLHGVTSQIVCRKSIHEVHWCLTAGQICDGELDRRLCCSPPSPKSPPPVQVCNPVPSAVLNPTARVPCCPAVHLSSCRSSPSTRTAQK